MIGREGLVGASPILLGVSTTCIDPSCKCVVRTCASQQRICEKPPTRVALATQALEQRKLVKTGRGWIQMMDRKGMIALADESYGAPAEEYV